VVVLESYAVVTETWEQFRIDGAVESVVDSLVGGGFVPTILIADFTNLSHLPGNVVGNCKSFNLSFFVKIVDCF